MIRREWLAHQPPPEACSASVSVTDRLRELVDDPRVEELLLARREQGREHYGTELTTHNGRDGRLDLLQELVDSLVYAGQLHLEHPSADSRSWIRELHDLVVRLVQRITGERAEPSAAPEAHQLLVACWALLDGAQDRTVFVDGQYLQRPVLRADAAEVEHVIQRLDALLRRGA